MKIILAHQQSLEPLWCPPGMLASSRVKGILTKPDLDDATPMRVDGLRQDTVDCWYHVAYPERFSMARRSQWVREDSNTEYRSFANIVMDVLVRLPALWHGQIHCRPFSQRFGVIAPGADLHVLDSCVRSLGTLWLKVCFRNNPDHACSWNDIGGIGWIPVDIDKPRPAPVLPRESDSVYYSSVPETHSIPVYASQDSVSQ